MKLEEKYITGEYLEKNPTWHIEKSPWKVRHIMSMLKRHHLVRNTICEIGCGAGEVLRLLQLRMSEACTFWGYDVSPQAIEMCKKRANERLHFKLADIRQEQEGFFDLLLVLDVIEHLEDYLSFSPRHPAEEPGAKAQAEYRFTPLAEGSVIEFGCVRLKALETPGHTPESISILVYDLDRSGIEPYAVLTGDTLFIGDVGRPDLRASLGWSATDLGSLLYDSLQSKLLPLPDASLVYPAHGAGSLCGKAISKETVSTMGDQQG